jgi:hypothetical protein
MDFFLLLSAIAFGIGALAQHLGRFGKFLNYLCAGFCFYVLSQLFSTRIGG